MRKGFYVPHLIYIWRESQAQCVGRNGLARLEARRAEREISLNFISVLTVEIGVR